MFFVSANAFGQSEFCYKVSFFPHIICYACVQGEEEYNIEFKNGLSTLLVQFPTANMYHLFRYMRTATIIFM